MAKRKLNKLFIVYQMVPHIVYAESPDDARDIAASNMQLNINEFAKKSNSTSNIYFRYS